MIAPEYFNNHIAVEGEIIVKTVPNNTGSVLLWNPTTKKISTRTTAEIASDFALLTDTSWNNIIGKKWFITDNGNNWDNNTLRIQGKNGYDAGVTFIRDGIDVAQLIFNGYYFSLVTSDSNTGFRQLKTAGVLKDGSSADYFLTGDGGHYSKYGKDDAWLHSSRNFLNGTLIKTTIDYSSVAGSPFFLEMKGNMYGGGMPMDCKVQGYIWDNTIINQIGYSTHQLLTEIIALNLGGELCFWFPRLSYWQGFSVKVTDVSGGPTGTTNKVYSIDDVVDPGGTKRVSIPIVTVATQSWVNDRLTTKANAIENGLAIGFSAGVYPTNAGNEYPFIYHGNPGSNTPYVALATQGFVNTNFIKTPDGYSFRSDGTDLNTVKYTGFLRGQSLINAPGGNTGWWYIAVEAHDTSWVKQTATAYGSGNTANETYQRVLVGGAWGDWQIVWNGGNLNPYNFVTQSYLTSNFYTAVQTNNFFIPKSHPAYEITSTDIGNFRTYIGYADNRQIRPSDVLTTKFHFGFTSWNNDNSAPYADYIHFGGYPDSSGGEQNLIMFKKSGVGIRQYQGSSQGVSPYLSYVDYWHTGNLNIGALVQVGGVNNQGNQIYLAWTGSNLQLTVDSTTIGNMWHSGNLNPTNYIDKTTNDQFITSRKHYFNLGNTNNYNDNSLWVRADDGSNPAMTFFKAGVAASQIVFTGASFQFRNNDSSGYFPVVSNSFILTGGTATQFLKADGSVDSNTYATQNYVQTKIADLVASSPSTLDTLNELAQALGNDPNFATTVATQIGTKANKSTTISAGTGLTGGGDLSDNRTLGIDAGTMAKINHGESAYNWGPHQDAGYIVDDGLFPKLERFQVIDNNPYYVNEAETKIINFIFDSNVNGSVYLDDWWLNQHFIVSNITTVSSVEVYLRDPITSNYILIGTVAPSTTHEYVSCTDHGGHILRKFPDCAMVW